MARITSLNILLESTGKLYRVQVGAFSIKANADAYLDKLKKAGFDGFVVEAEK